MGLKGPVTTVFATGSLLLTFVIGAATFGLAISLLAEGKRSNNIEHTCGVCPSVTYTQCRERVLAPEEHAENAG
jgi:hypothetical protein